jgi:hypothetical protein
LRGRRRPLQASGRDPAEVGIFVHSIENMIPFLILQSSTNLK